MEWTVTSPTNTLWAIHNTSNYFQKFINSLHTGQDQSPIHVLLCEVIPNIHIIIIFQ